MKRSVAILVVLGAAALAQERAASPGNGVVLLKEAWEAGDLNAVVARYAEPGASYLRSDLAMLRRVERAQETLGSAVRAKLGAAAEQELVPQEKRVVSPLQNASVTMLMSKIKGDRATTKFRVATREGERFFRFTHVREAGEWKILLAGIDGIPLDEKALKRMATITEAHGRAADSLERLASDVTAGVLSGKDAIKKKIARILAEERQAAISEERSERRDDGHEND